MGGFKLQLSKRNPNTRAHSESAFEEGGIWDNHQGPDQTRGFAECLHRHCYIPWREFSLLDVGCALGDALAVWHEKYPTAKLFGCDVADSAIRRCRERYAGVAHFFQASFEGISGFWDIIYCSNVLEHFEQYLDIAEVLLAQCKLLLLLAPFAELKDGSPLGRGHHEDYHVTTLFRNSFDDLVSRGSARRVETSVFCCPRAGWGFTPHQRLRWLLGAVLRNRYIVQEPLQILYAIHGPACSDLDFVRDDGRYPR
jgi:hypothetical protein